MESVEDHGGDESGNTQETGGEETPVTPYREEGSPGTTTTTTTTTTTGGGGPPPPPGGPEQPALKKNGSSRAASPAESMVSESFVRELRQEARELHRQRDELQRESGNLREERGRLASRVRELEEKLKDERAAASERKRKIKSYVESLDVEKARLETEIKETRKRAEDADELRKLAESRCEAALKEAETLRTEAASIQAEAASMKHAVDELATHKSKRLAAKSEMVALARVLESEREKATSAEKKLREHAVPRLGDHVASLRDLVTRLDDLHALARRGRPSSTRRSFAGPRSGPSFSSADVSNPMVPGARSTTPGGGENQDDDDVASHSSGSASGVEGLVDLGGTGARRGARRPSKESTTTNNKTDALTDALHRLDREADRVASGLGLLAQNMDLLEDALHSIRPCPPCLAALLDTLWPLQTGLSSQSGTGLAPPPRSRGPGLHRTPSAGYAKVDLGHADHDDDVL